ncbi:MAG: hypothetical protein AABX51_08570 [Nanoarchaeota archaeon]
MIIALTAISALLIFFFLKPELTGRVVTRTTVINAQQASCNFTLSNGWNLISIPCAPFSEYSVGEFSGLFNISPVSIHTYLASDSSDPWKAYKSGLPAWVVQDINSISDKNGYWVNMNDSGRLDVTSVINTPRTIAVVAGWNLVGYPTKNPKRVNESLVTLFPNWRELRYYNSSDSSYYVFYNITQTGDFTNQTPYSGYWIYMSTSGTWVVSW